MVLLAELADKTQLITFALVAETGKPVQVYLGVLGGLFCVTAIGVLAGSLIALLIPLSLIQIIAGGAFIILGVFVLYKTTRNQEEDTESIDVGKHVWARAFVFLFLAEIGDKTQLIVILVTATTAQLWLVFLAAFIALALVNGIGVLVGDRARKYLKTKTIRYLAATAFIFAGILVLFSIL